jgi:2-polyprenyl-3-methyl-5-hydroxy-6-metoxy-1,4-benzoquinol methylase
MRPWFGGDRSVEEQCLGLDLLFKHAVGKSVLDVGCAEGDIALLLASTGASRVYGIEIVPEHIEVAKYRRDKLGLLQSCGFKVADAQEFLPGRQYDIVLLLAILHKLPDPTDALKGYMAHCNDMIVIRWPIRGPDTIIDQRSNWQKHKITKTLLAGGFAEILRTDGPRGELVSYFRRGS